MSDTSTIPRTRRLLVICPFPIGVAAGQRLKYEQYFEDWRKIGFEIEVSPFMDTAMWRTAYVRGALVAKVFGVLRGHVRRIRDMFRVYRYDVVYVCMWVTPFGTSLFERLTRYFARRLIFDVEDNVLVDQNLPSGYNPNAIVRRLKGPRKARYLIRSADAVITSSPFLNELCMRINERHCCTYISSSIDTDRFIPANPYSNDRIVTIGWTGTYSSLVYLEMLRGVFSKLAKRVPFRLRVIGNFDWEIDGVDLEVVRWTKEHEARDMQGIDIGVYPLPINDWVLGKSGLKAIQYMAFGLPVVATNVGTTPLLITNDVNGLLVKTESDWLDALEHLVRDPQLRRRLGEAARTSAVERYSTKVIAGQYRRVLYGSLEQTKL